MFFCSSDDPFVILCWQAQLQLQLQLSLKLKLALLSDSPTTWPPDRKSSENLSGAFNSQSGLLDEY